MAMGRTVTGEHILTARRTAGELAGVDVEYGAGDAARLERCDERAAC
jgi:hypothetical protein